MRKDVYAGHNTYEAGNAYFDAWFIEGSWNGIMPQPVLEMARYAFRYGFGGKLYLFDRDFMADGNGFFGFINEAHQAGIRAYDEWTEGN